MLSNSLVTRSVKIQHICIPVYAISSAVFKPLRTSFMSGESGVFLLKLLLLLFYTSFTFLLHFWLICCLPGFMLTHTSFGIECGSVSSVTGLGCGRLLTLMLS